VRARTRVSAVVRERAQRRGKDRTGEGKDEPSADMLGVVDTAGTAAGEGFNVAGAAML
jgi:hypothetical protein